MTLERLHTHYRLTIEVLSPLHIGNGNELLREYDYVAQGGRTWVIDQERLLEATLGAEGEFDNALLSSKPAELLRSDDFHTDSPLFRYVMPGEPTNRPLREQIKDVWGRPYLPGSTVKGALRTLLMWGIYTAENRVPALNKAQGQRSWAAQPLERELFAPAAQARSQAPTLDVLKSIQIADSNCVAVEALHVASTLIYPTSNKSGGVIVDVEALKPETVFDTRIAIEEYGFEDEQARRILKWDDLRVWFERIPAIGRKHAGNRLAEEIEFHKRTGPKTALYFYARIVKQWEQLADNEWLAQIGWGTSWHSKTLNNLLAADKQGFERDVIRQYGLARGRRSPGDPFPKTRNLVISREQPASPMGWVKCRLEPL